MIQRVLFLFLALSLLQCSSISQPTKIKSLSPGNSSITLKHNNLMRRYIVHVPNKRPSGEAYPVVLNFHGGGGSAQRHQEYTKMDETADRAGFIAVYPNGSGVFSNRLLTWNAGKCCGYAKEHNVDDVSFTREIIQDLSLRVAIDRTRIYATGLSNGAMFSYRLAMEVPDLIKAIAPVAGAMSTNNFNPVKPISIMHFHSVDDPRALYKGGLGPPFPMTNHRVMHQAVEEVLQNWRNYNACPQQFNSELSQKITTANGQTAEKIVFAPCRNNTQVVLWKLSKAGHVWPGSPDFLTHILGPSTNIINANEEMWKFFEQKI